MSRLPHLDADGPVVARPYVRWSVWLLAGTLAGVVAGFAVGLGRPRPRPGATGPTIGRAW